MRKLKGFTLIELLIVIAIIAIIAAVVFVALDPLTRFQDARDAARWQDISAVMSAIKVNQVDNGGSYIAAVSGLAAGEVFQIGTAVAGCNLDAAATPVDNCDTNPTDADNCVSLAGLVTAGYLGEVPTSPNGAGTWTAALTGYTIQRDSTGIITIRACESENSPELTISR
ncbi:MAG: prepilin-type N-terminal cleavage/methylation domain-containing protein [bacterium]